MPSIGNILLRGSALLGTVSSENLVELKVLANKNCWASAQVAYPLRVDDSLNSP